MNIELLPLPDAEVSLKMKCEDCGHVQTVHGVRREGSLYFGSAYNWCDKCESGLPVAIEEVQIKKFIK